jgi:hypothetical protein
VEFDTFFLSFLLVSENLEKLKINELLTSLHSIDKDKLQSLFDEWNERIGKYPLKKLEEYFSLNVASFIDLLEECWKAYLDGIQFMDILYPHLVYKRLYPKKVEVLYHFLDTFSKLEEITYSLTAIERNVVKNIPNRTQKVDYNRLVPLSSSTTLNFSELSNKLFKIIDPELIYSEEYLRLMIYKNPYVREVFEKCGQGNVINFIFFLEKLMKFKSDIENKIQKSGKDLEHSYDNYYNIRRILTFDLEIVELAIPFYYKLSKLLNVPLTIKDIKDALKKLKNEYENKFLYKIPKYYQNGPTCGVACLLNILETFKDVKGNKNLEMEIFKRVTVENYPNNLGSCLAFEAKKYGLPTYFIIDLEEYENKVIKNSKFANDPRVKKFLECMKNVKTVNKKILSKEEIVEYLKNGYMIAMAGTREDTLHFRLFYGYEINKNNSGISITFYVFDPLAGKLKSEDIEIFIRNPYGMWGFVVGAPDIPVIEEIERNYLPRVNSIITIFENITK